MTLRGTKRLTVAQACRFLGVSATALRQWTDEGKVRAFVTPGGHRRYKEADLVAFIRSHRRAQGVKDLMARIEERAFHQELARKYFLPRPWYEGLREKDRLRFRERGRRLVELILFHIAHHSREEATLVQARALGVEYSRHLSELGLPLNEALEAFTLHRSAVLDAVTEMMKDRQLVNRRALDALPHIIRLVDRVLLFLVEAYQTIPEKSGAPEKPEAP